MESNFEKYSTDRIQGLATSYDLGNKRINRALYNGTIYRLNAAFMKNLHRIYHAL